MFRELKFESDADVGQTETFYKGLDIIYPYVGGLPFRSKPTVTRHLFLELAFGLANKNDFPAKLTELSTYFNKNREQFEGPLGQIPWSRNAV